MRKSFVYLFFIFTVVFYLGCASGGKKKTTDSKDKKESTQQKEEKKPEVKSSEEKKSEKPAEAKPADNKEEKNKWVQLYEDRCAGFKKECEEISADKTKKSAGQIVMLGDSITQGFKLNQFFPGRLIVNRGIASDHLYWVKPYENMGVMHRISPDVLAPNPTKCFILIGINDINYTYKNNKDGYWANYKEMIQNLKKNYPEMKIYVQSLLPTREKYEKFKEPVLEFNASLKKIAEAERCEYINLHPLMADEKGDLKKEFTRDGLHLTDEAYKVWKAEIEKRF